MTDVSKRLALIAATGVVLFGVAVCQAQSYVQQSYGANSNNTVNVYATQTLDVQKLQPEIRAIIRTLENEKSHRMHQIGHDFREGRSDAALVHIHDALMETRADATRLAFLHYAAGHALLLRSCCEIKFWVC